MKKEDYINSMVQLKGELIDSMNQYKEGAITKFQFYLILRGAKDIVVNSGFCFKYDEENGEETDEVVEMDGWTKEAITESLTNIIDGFNAGDYLQLNCGSGSILVLFVGEKIWNNFE